MKKFTNLSFLAYAKHNRGLTSEGHTECHVLCIVCKGLFMSTGWIVCNYVLKVSRYVGKGLKALKKGRGTTGLRSHVNSRGKKVSDVMHVRIEQCMSEKWRTKLQKGPCEKLFI